MDEIIIFLTLFFFVFIIFLLIGLYKLKFKKLDKYTEYRILTKRYKVDDTKYKPRSLVFVIAFANSFIITNAAMITFFINTSSYMMMMLVGVVVLSLLIIIVYSIIGKIIGSR